MAIDYSQLPLSKGTPRVIERAKQRKALARDERTAREATRARDKGKCRIPGCKERATELHHIVPRSRSKRLRHATGNLVWLCLSHHRLRHAGVINIAGNADEELIVTGDLDALKFRL